MQKTNRFNSGFQFIFKWQVFKEKRSLMVLMTIAAIDSVAEVKRCSSICAVMKSLDSRGLWNIHYIPLWIHNKKVYLINQSINSIVFYDVYKPRYASF